MRRERERDSEENAQASRGERATPRPHIINGARATLNARRLFRGEGPGAASHARRLGLACHLE